MTVIIYYLGTGNSISVSQHGDVETFSIHQNEVTITWNKTDEPITFTYTDLHRIEIIP